MFVIIRPAAKQVFKSQMHWLIEKAKGVTFFPKRPLPPQIFLFFSWWHKRREQVEKRKFCLIAKNLFSTFLTREQNFSDIFQSNALRPEMTFSKFSTGTKKKMPRFESNEVLSNFYNYHFTISLWLKEGKKPMVGKFYGVLRPDFARQVVSSIRGRKRSCCRQIPRNIIGVFRHVEKLLPCFALGISQMIWGLYWRPTFRRHIPEEMKKKSAKHTLCFNKSP